MGKPLIGVAAAGCAMLGAVLWVSSTEQRTASPDTTGDAVVLRDATLESGLHEPLTGILGHGAAWGDYDGDGAVDLYVGGFSDRPAAEYEPAPGPVPNHLFRNLGNGRFEVVPQPSVTVHARTSGALFADLDNDGDPELLVSNNARREARTNEEPQRSALLARSQLFRNDAGTFVEITDSSGLGELAPLSARNVGLLDFDKDGLLDLLLIEDRFIRGAGSVLLHNDGGLVFSAVPDSGIPGGLFGLGLAVADLNRDGRGDIFVAHSNRLFLSRPDNTYIEATWLQDVFHFEPLDAEDWPSGAAFGDLDRDGWLDLVVTAHHEPARNRVFLNDATGTERPTFREVTGEAGLGEPVPNKSPHVEIQDFDNDGWPDIYTTAAWLEEGAAVPLIYRNLGVRGGVPRFEPIRPITGPMVYYPAGPSGDYDGDGRIDLFLVNWFRGNHSRLLHNEGPGRNWLKVRVEGRTFNRMGIGAKVKIYRPGDMGEPDSLLGYQEVGSGYGYGSGQAAECHFGLGQHDAVDVEVTLPDGRVVGRAGVAARRTVMISEQGSP